MNKVGCDVEIRMMQDGHRRINAAAKLGLIDFARAVLANMRSGVAVLSGATRDSLSMRVRSRSPFIRISWFTRSGHGGYLEKGTRKMAAEPYMFPAFEQTSAQLPEFLRARFAEIPELSGDVPDEIVNGVKSKLAKGVGIIGASEAKKKQRRGGP